MTIKRRHSITPKKCAELIKKKFKDDDRIVVYNENPAPPYGEGWCMDTAKCVIKNLLDPEVFTDDTTYNFTVGLVKIDTNKEYY